MIYTGAPDECSYHRTWFGVIIYLDEEEGICLAEEEHWAAGPASHFGEELARERRSPDRGRGSSDISSGKGGKHAGKGSAKAQPHISEHDKTPGDPERAEKLDKGPGSYEPDPERGH